MRLEGKVAVIVGAGQSPGEGIGNGRATTLRFAREGATYHAEHHLYPAVPFHQLPALHRLLRQKLAHVAPNYRAANRAVIQSL
jgi:fatty acid desaturase